MHSLNPALWGDMLHGSIADIGRAAFWTAVLQIVFINIVLSGDNAVVIALACRNLPDQQRTRGIVLGTLGAILLRVVLIAFAVMLLDIPFLKFLGGLLLLWIGVKLMQPDHDAHEINASDRLWAAVKTIIVADAVMSLDNVIAIAGAAEAADPRHRLTLVIFGLVVSIQICSGAAFAGSSSSPPSCEMCQMFRSRL